MLLGGLVRQPRFAYQGSFAASGPGSRFAASMPKLVPVRGGYHGALAVLDWDHRLPSRTFTLRVYCYYTAETLAAGEAAYDDRVEDIGARDRYPEFDVPDFADLPADEAYEVELAPTGEVQKCRLTSAWRREVADKEALWAVDAARASKEFREVSAQAGDRPRHLGDLEAVSWTPPCESGHAKWTVDVWYLMAFDGRVGSGRSLLVELGERAKERRVVALRDFAVRAG